MKDRHGTPLAAGDVVVVEAGKDKGLVGPCESAGLLHIRVTPDLWAPWRTERVVLRRHVRRANDIERARWRRDARARERIACDTWLDGPPVKGD